MCVHHLPLSAGRHPVCSVYYSHGCYASAALLPGAAASTALTPTKHAMSAPASVRGGGVGGLAPKLADRCHFLITWVARSDAGITGLPRQLALWSTVSGTGIEFRQPATTAKRSQGKWR